MRRIFKRGSDPVTSQELRIGTRGSQLALYQANWVKNRLMEAHPRLNVSLVTIKTTGDKIQDAPLAMAGVKRFGLEARITEVLPVEISLPAIGTELADILLGKGAKEILDEIYQRF